MSKTTKEETQLTLLEDNSSVSTPLPKKKDLNRLHNGDCFEFLKTVDSNSVDLIVSSPPYNIGKEYEDRSCLKKYLANQEAVLKECFRVLKDTGSIFWQVGVYVDDHGGHVPLDIKFFEIFHSMGMSMRNRMVWLRPHGLHATKRFSCRYETILWFAKNPDNYKFHLDPIKVPQKYQNKKAWKGDKKGQLTCDPIGKNPGDVWAFRNVKHNHEEQTIHPCQFPEDMIERIVLSTTDRGDVVLDPYMGTGTVAVVANRFERYYLGAELDKGYYETANLRVSGEPDKNGVFANLKCLREYAEKHQITDVSKFRFQMQVGKIPTTRDKAKIFDEQHHLEEFETRVAQEAESPAFKRFPDLAQ
jgi:adenine-specific DNA-methyltransferase